MLNHLENQEDGKEFGVPIEIEEGIPEDYAVRIVNVLKNVFDPDISYNIYDMGLIYGITITDKKIHILMTLTSINCPAAQSLPDDVEEQLKMEFPEHEVEVEMTFSPPWTIDNLQEYVKLGLRLI